MNRTAVGVVAVVVIIGALWYFSAGNGAGILSGVMMPGDGAAAPQTAQQQTPGGTSMSLRALLASGESQVCTFDETIADTPTSGIVYVGGGQARTDFSATQQGTSMSVHIVSDGEDMYTWIDGMKDGFKASMTAEMPDAARQQGFDPDKSMEYHCQAWTVDESMFVKPADVNFRDMAALLKGAPIQTR